jgi:hypothetical protein
MFSPASCAVRAIRSGALIAFLLVSACVPTVVEELEPEEESEVLARTAFTERIENFFEYDALKAGQSSQFLIHLTDLEDGTPVFQAQVELSVRSASGAEVAETTAQVGRVTGIYVADLLIPSPGTYSIEFSVGNDRLDEDMTLSGFNVE